MRISDWSSDVCSSDLLIALAERGDLGGCSFGFVVNAGGDAWNGTVRELHSVELREVSIVQAWPAYADTEIHLRSLQPAHQLAALHRSEERRVGTECVRTCRSRWSPHQ